MISGSCKCRAVQYEYDGDFGVITICHCADCRKLQGGGGVLAAPAQSQLFRWISGRESITEYESSPGKMRAFCRQCGTPLYSRRVSAPQVLRLRMGSIDSPITDMPVAHIFCTDLPPWATLDDDWPRYARHEPGRG